MKTARCLQHVPFEGPAAFAPVLESLGYRIDCCLVPEDGLPPDPGDFLLVMGGPMSANDPDPWIAEEIAFIRHAVNAGTPYLGVCLGSQLLAKAVGGSVHKGPVFEISVMDLSPTRAAAADPCFAALPNPFTAFEWHGEGIEVPDTCAVLAASAHFPVQAFRAAPRAYGLLFHLEVTEDTVTALCEHCPQDIAAARSDPAVVQDQTLPHLPDLNARAAAFLQALLRV